MKVPENTQIELALQFEIVGCLFGPVKIKINKPNIDETKAIMRESIAEMKLLLDYFDENVATIENFPMIEDRDICRKCQFKGICYPDSWR